MLTRSSVVLVFVVLASTSGTVRPSGAQSARTEADTLNALLVEVRALRAAMETLASAGPRVQLAFGRLQLHEQRINGMVRRMETLRERIGTATREEDMLRTRLKRAEDAAARGALSDEERKQVEAELPMLRNDAARAAYELQQLQAEEGAITSEIALEQGRWNEINQRLDELERSLLRK